MKRISEAGENTRNQLTMLAIINIGYPIEVVTVDGECWKGTLGGYRDECLLVDEGDGTGLYEWEFEALKSLTVEKPLSGQTRLITLPGG